MQKTHRKPDNCVVNADAVCYNKHKGGGKMKKAVVIFGAMILVLAVTFFSLYFAQTVPRYAGDFSLDQYREETENINFQTDGNYGTIPDFKSAAKAGKAAIAERFDAPGSLFAWMRCDVRYDLGNDAYYVRMYRAMSFGMGGAYDVIIRSDGTVLAIWGEK